MFRVVELVPLSSASVSSRLRSALDERVMRYDNQTWVYDTDAGTWAQMGPN